MVTKQDMIAEMETEPILQFKNSEEQNDESNFEKESKSSWDR